MKALITAGGHGTRLRPLTFTSNKHLIPVANKPMIFYSLEAVRGAGITDIGMIVNETRPVIEELLGNGKKFGVHITYIDQDEPRGLGHCLMIAERFLGKDPFVFYLGDNVLAGGIDGFVSEFKKTKPNCQLLLAKVPDPERFGVAVLNKKGEVIRTVEKPKHPETPFAITGVYLLDHHCFEAFRGKDAIKISARGEFEIPDVFQYLLDHGYKVRAHNVTGWWKDTGKMEDLLAANRLVLERQTDGEIKGSVDKISKLAGIVRIGKGTKIVNSELRGPVVIGENVEVRDSYIGPFTSLYNGCVIHNSEIEHSVVLGNVTIRDVERRIDNSLIGQDVTIVQNHRHPKTYSFMVGDNAKVHLV
ncbi:MAG TPA: glucose-1-phosphate thymidylyltransferase [Patescibacteria group bacterium]|nr:glucose-1-phosphate thymidylyltransferase [Patescibacteria group bacterium]